MSALYPYAKNKISILKKDFLSIGHLTWWEKEYRVHNIRSKTIPKTMLKLILIELVQLLNV